MCNPGIFGTVEETGFVACEVRPPGPKGHEQTQLSRPDETALSVRCPALHRDTHAGPPAQRDFCRDRAWTSAHSWLGFRPSVTLGGSQRKFLRESLSLGEVWPRALGGTEETRCLREGCLRDPHTHKAAFRDESLMGHHQSLLADMAVKTALPSPSPRLAVKVSGRLSPRSVWVREKRPVQGVGDIACQV